ncbi:PilZ domain-containing protein [Bradyrhizobium sp. 76]|uniref:PilZ domain-containing protein n=1 Tax=Bradyrhizobium sp. 76 TaxID=2782680 RepID=UPI001FFA759D|nr:PilZ domain-containing protein [Bradyrhizobium sp. 76]MCK1404956.1 PilZ domain-containing protein [Bradyrhizobium sp. 76]
MYDPAPRSPRREARRSRHQSAWIILVGGAHRECRVMDLSESGAKLFAVVTVDLPTKFELAFVQGGTRRRCDVMWRRGKMLGVQFA